MGFLTSMLCKKFEPAQNILGPVKGHGIKELTDELAYNEFGRTFCTCTIILHNPPMYWYEIENLMTFFF